METKDILDCIKKLDEAPIPTDDRMVWYEDELYENSTGKWKPAKEG